MFENGSLLRRRKRFKLHKPDKELLNSELQALASTFPPATVDASAGSSAGGLSAANLHRLKEDLIQWEIHEKQMMTAAAASSGAAGVGYAFPGNNHETSNGFYFISPEAQQRLTGGQPSAHIPNSDLRPETGRTSWAWDFAGLSTSAYVHSMQPFLVHHQQSTTDEVDPRLQGTSGIIPTPGGHLARRHPLQNHEDLLRGVGTGGGVQRLDSEDSARSAEDQHFLRTLSSRNYETILQESMNERRERFPKHRKENQQRQQPVTKEGHDTDDFYHGLQLPPVLSRSVSYKEPSPGREQTQGQTVISQKKRKKRPFTIENIIAPDNDDVDEVDTVLVTAGKAHPLAPRPLYAGFAQIQPLALTASGIHKHPSY